MAKKKKKPKKPFFSVFQIKGPFGYSAQIVNNITGKSVDLSNVFDESWSKADELCKKLNTTLSKFEMAVPLEKFDEFWDE